MSIHASFAGVALPPLVAAVPPKRRSLGIVRANVEPSEKSVELMRKFSEQYARRSGTYFCFDKGVTSVVIKAHPGLTGKILHKRGSLQNLAIKHVWVGVALRGLLSTKTVLEHPYVLAGIMMTKLLRCLKDFGIVHVYPCVRGRSAIVCSF